MGALAVATSGQTEANASTWMFLGVLGAVTAVVLVGWARTIATWRPPAIRDDLVTPRHFYATHGHHDEIDLGRHWRSTDDPGVSWHVWWLPGTGELIGVRTAEEPPPVAIWAAQFGRYSTAASPVAGLGGMKSLGRSGRIDRHATDHLRVRPDGLDLLCGGTGSRGHLVAG